jgi:hypothetical protein
MKFRVAGFWIALLLAPLANAQGTFVVPSSSEAVEGDSNNAIPFSSTDGNVRYQQVYLDSDIPPGPFTIYGIDIFLVTTEENTNLNPNSDVNVGLDYQLVASGPLPLASAASGPVGGPLAFDI